MNTRRLLVVSGVVICAAALAVLWRASRMNATAKRALAALPQQRASLALLVRTAEERLASAEGQRACLHAALDVLRTSKPVRPAPAAAPVAGSRAKPLPPGARPSNWREQLLNNPELQAMYFSSMHPLMTRHFAPFYHALQLPPAQIEKFEAAFFKRDEQLTDLTAVREAQGPDVASAVATFQKRVHVEFDATLRDVLGPEGMSHNLQFQRMAQASWAYARGGPTDLTTINWDVVDAQAEQILSPAQCALLKRAGVRCEAQMDDAIARAKKAEAAAGPAKAGGPSG